MLVEIPDPPFPSSPVLLLFLFHLLILIPLLLICHRQNKQLSTALLALQPHHPDHPPSDRPPAPSLEQTLGLDPWDETFFPQSHRSSTVESNPPTSPRHPHLYPYAPPPSPTTIAINSLELVLREYLSGVKSALCAIATHLRVDSSYERFLRWAAAGATAPLDVRACYGVADGFPSSYSPCSSSSFSWSSDVPFLARDEDEDDGEEDDGEEEAEGDGDGEGEGYAAGDTSPTSHRHLRPLNEREMLSECRFDRASSRHEAHFSSAPQASVRMGAGKKGKKGKQEDRTEGLEGAQTSAEGERGGAGSEKRGGKKGGKRVGVVGEGACRERLGKRKGTRGG